MEITSRTRDGGIRWRLARGVGCTHKQFIMLHASNGARPVRSGAITTLLLSTVRILSVRSVISIMQAGICPQII